MYNACHQCTPAGFDIDLMTRTVLVAHLLAGGRDGPDLLNCELYGFDSILGNLIKRL